MNDRQNINSIIKNNNNADYEESNNNLTPVSRYYLTPQELADAVIHSCTCSSLAESKDAGSSPNA